MPKEFLVEFKQLAFSIIDFVKKKDSSIPLNSITDRLQVMLGICQRSEYRLKHEMKELKGEQERLVRRTRSSSSSLSPIALSPVSHSGRPKVQLIILEEDTIRFIFHQLLKDKVYPIVETLLSTLLDQNPQLPIQSKISLLRKMKELGFKYRETKKAKVLMDLIAFQAQRAVYFRKLDQLRSSKCILYYLDEIWLNKNEEKSVVWFDDKGYCHLRSNEGQGVE